MFSMLLQLCGQRFDGIWPASDYRLSSTTDWRPCQSIPVPDPERYVCTCTYDQECRHVVCVHLYVTYGVVEYLHIIVFVHFCGASKHFDLLAYYTIMGWGSPILPILPGYKCTLAYKIAQFVPILISLPNFDSSLIYWLPSWVISLPLCVNQFFFCLCTF